MSDIFFLLILMPEIKIFSQRQIYFFTCLKFSSIQVCYPRKIVILHWKEKGKKTNK